MPDKSTHEPHALFSDEWERTLRENPLLASELGDKRYADRWPDVSLDAIQRRHQENQRVVERLDAIDQQQLSQDDKLNYELFRRKYETAIEDHQYRWDLLPLTAREGIQDANAISDSIVFETTQDYDDWLLRLSTFAEYMDQTIALMREGVKSGMVHAKVVMQRVPAQIQRQIVDDPEASLFFKPLRQFPATVEEHDRRRMIAGAKKAIEGGVVPAFQKLLAFFRDEYLPACYDQVGVWQLPRGEEMYSFFARKFTTTGYTPQQIHDVGLAEVRRIRREMEEIVSAVGFSGGFQEFLDFLRTDPQFYFDNPDDLMSAYRELCKRVDKELPKLFRRLPKVWYDIQPIPSNIAPDTTTAYYRPLSADGKRAGTYFVNLYKPEVRPKYEIEALSLHEAVPGHHLQIGLSAELEDLPPFRRYAPEGDYTGYVEGWALYAEALGEQLGCYRDPYSKFGQLTYEMWRAVRLVVDTGIHALRWTRQQAIDLFRQNTAKTAHDIENEIDRYIAWPGQALAYKIGEIEMWRLRRFAENELGPRFEVAEFHEVVLGSGALPLDTLEANVRRWVADFE